MASLALHEHVSDKKSEFVPNTEQTDDALSGTCFLCYINPVAGNTDLDSFGKRIHQLLKVLPDAVPITDTFDYLLGAVHGLRKATALGFKDRPLPYVDEYRPWLTQYALYISTGKSLNSLWESGFYFNSGIQRIAALFDRIPKLLGAPETLKGNRTTTKERMVFIAGTKQKNWESVYDEVNAFKHEPGGKALGRDVLMEHALAALEEIVTLLEGKTKQLIASYGP